MFFVKFQRTPFLKEQLHWLLLILTHAVLGIIHSKIWTDPGDWWFKYFPGCFPGSLNSEREGGQLTFSLSLSGFSKNVFSTERVKHCFFVTFNVISHIFPESFIEIFQVVHKIWRFSSSVLAIFINFLDFLTFPCYKETNDVSIK